LSVADASLQAIHAGSDMVLICESAENVVAARDAIVDALKNKQLPTKALKDAGNRIDRVLDVAALPEPFDEEEFETASSDIAELKRALHAAENDEEYAPEYGVTEGEERRSGNF
jgi:beta-glucosidase-like glycosyl hydrolase